MAALTCCLKTCSCVLWLNVNPPHTVRLPPPHTVRLPPPHRSACRTSPYSDTAISVGKVVTAIICKQNFLPLDTSPLLMLLRPLLMLLRPLLTSLAVPRGQYWSHIGTAVTESCCPQTSPAPSVGLQNVAILGYGHQRWEGCNGYYL